MGSTVTTLGGVTVVFDTRSEAQIDAALKRLEDGRALFLDKERHPRSGEVVYVVRQWVGSGVPPVRVLDWCEPDGTPRPLSDGVVYAVARRREFFGRNLAAETVRENDEHRRRVADRSLEEKREIARDFARHRRVGNFMIVPRSMGLARTRARMRSEGKAS